MSIFPLVSIWFNLDTTDTTDASVAPVDSKDGNFLSSSLLYISRVGKIFPKLYRVHFTNETGIQANFLLFPMILPSVKVWEYKYILSI